MVKKQLVTLCLGPILKQNDFFELISRSQDPISWIQTSIIFCRCVIEMESNSRLSAYMMALKQVIFLWQLSPLFFLVSIHLLVRLFRYGSLLILVIVPNLQGLRYSFIQLSELRQSLFTQNGRETPRIQLPPVSREIILSTLPGRL